MTEHIKQFTWLTPNQNRDFFLSGGRIELDTIQTAKNIANEEQARRLKDINFVQCPRCKGCHSEKFNSDNLCEKCEQIVHVMQWDKNNIKSLSKEAEE